MDTAAVMRWVEAYERAWRDSDLAAVEALFTPDAAYRFSPYEPSQVGHDAIRAFWADDAGREFSFVAEPVAVQGERAVVRATVVYADGPQEYGDLWVLRFAADGRVSEFEEWAYWPGASYAVSGSD